MKIKSWKIKYTKTRINGEKFLEGDILYKKIQNLKNIKEEQNEEEKSERSGK